MQKFSDQVRSSGKKIAFVPTMGYLHEGHLSLVKKAKELAEVVVVSTFVNPTQFSPNEDLDKYPRNLERDKNLLEEYDVDVIFHPEASEIYPPDFQTYVDVKKITKVLEGTSRPTHFAGVTTIVSILFNCVKPHFAIFGQKDAQQAAVIRQMVSDLKIDTEIIVSPIIRERDGLAMSSRNIYLSEKERKDALVLNKSLHAAEELIKKGERESSVIYDATKKIIDSVDSSDLDYVRIVDDKSFEELNVLEEGKSFYILIACRIGKTRLIDNLHLHI